MDLVVLIVVSSEDDGGAARSAFLLARELPASGVLARVVVHREGRLTARLADAGLPYDILPTLVEHPLRRQSDGSQTWKALRSNVPGLARAAGQLRSLARKYGATVLYGQGTWANYQAALAGSRSRAMAVWHIRDDHTAWLTRRVSRSLARLASVGAIIAVSESAARPYRGLPNTIAVVHNGVDLALCDRARQRPLLRERLGLGPAAVVAGYAGRLVPHKGIDCLMQAARIALSRAAADLHVVILGGNPRRLRTDVLAELRGRAAAWGLADRIHLPGHVEDVERWMADLDILVVPSVFSDPCPRAVLEGLALGLPIIASRTGGIPEIVRDGTDAVLVSPGDAVELAGAVLGLAGNPDRRRAMATAAVEAARARFDATDVARRIAAVLRGLPRIV